MTSYDCVMGILFEDSSFACIETLKSVMMAKEIDEEVR